MIVLFTEISFLFLIVSGLLVLFRLVRGPDTPNRILAFESLTICVVGLVVLLSLQWRTALFVELLLVIAALGFFGTMSYTFYLRRLDILDALEPETESESQNQRCGRCWQ